MTDAAFSRAAAKVESLFDAGDDDEDDTSVASANVLPPRHAAAATLPPSEGAADEQASPARPLRALAAIPTTVVGAPVALASAHTTLTALVTVCSGPCVAAGVLETAARFLLHLSQSFFDTAVRRPAQNLAVLSRAQEEELSTALSKAIDEATSGSDGSSGVVVSDKTTSALVKRHHGQRREFSERAKAKRREACKAAVADFGAFVVNAASDYNSVVHNPAAHAGEHLLSDVAATLPLVDFEVEADVPAAQLTVANPLAAALLDNTADPTAPPLVLDVSPTSALPICVQLPLASCLSSGPTPEPASEQASARRFAHNLRRQHASRRHGVLLYLGGWGEFRTLVDDARSRAVDPLWSGEDLPEAAPAAAIDAAGGTATFGTSNVWGASICVFCPVASGRSDKWSAADLRRVRAVMRRVLVASATTWRADMLSVALGPALGEKGGAAAAVTEILGGFVDELAWASRECHALRNLTQSPCAPLVPAGGTGSGRAGSYTLGMSIRVFVPEASLGSAIGRFADAGVKVTKKLKREQGLPPEEPPAKGSKPSNASPRSKR